MQSAVPVVGRLAVAPVKALAVQYPSSIRLEPDGVPEDRRLFLLDEAGDVVTLRRFPELTAVAADLDLTAGRLTITLPGGETVGQDLVPSGPPVGASLFGKARSGRVTPGPVSDALSAYVGTPLRLVHAERTGTGWDEGPVSIVGAASVAAVGTPDREDGPRASRYRMLIETTGDRPFAEDEWVGSRLVIGTAVVAVSHALGRCVVVDHDPADGTKDWAGLKALMAARGETNLGVIAEVVTPGTIRLGDPIEPQDRSGGGSQRADGGPDRHGLG